MALIVPRGDIKHPGHLSSVGSPRGDKPSHVNPQASLIEERVASASSVLATGRTNWKTLDSLPGRQSDEATFELLGVEAAAGFLPR